MLFEGRRLAEMQLGSLVAGVCKRWELDGEPGVEYTTRWASKQSEIFHFNTKHMLQQCCFNTTMQFAQVTSSATQIKSPHNANKKTQLNESHVT